MRQPLSREAISAAAREILVNEGLHSVSLRRVAGSLGVTAPALYAHVVDKRDLLQGIAEQEFESLLDRFRSISEGDPVERLRKQAHTYISYACDNPDLFRAMFLFRPELTSEERGDGPALTSRALQAFTDTVRAGIERGSFPADTDPRLLGLTVWTAVHGAATALLTGPPLDVELEARLPDAAVNAVIDGLTRKNAGAGHSVVC
jgi:AcrR family transcriptional regulator